MNAFRLTAAIALGIAAAAPAQELPLGATTANVFHYQATLTGADGVLLDGYHDVSLSVFDAPTDGARIWGPWPAPGDETFPVHSGLLELIVGPRDTADRHIHGAFTADERYIELTVDGAPIAPREPVRSAPYALTEQVTGFQVSEFASFNVSGPASEVIATASVVPEGRPVLILVNSGLQQNNAVRDVHERNVIIRLTREESSGVVVVREWTNEGAGSFSSTYPLSLMHIDPAPETPTYSLELEVTDSANAIIQPGTITLVTLDQIPPAAP